MRRFGASKVARAVVAFAWTVTADAAAAQTVSQRGFVEARGFFFPQEATIDPTRIVADFLAREEAFVKPAPWLQFAGGLDARANTHGQVEDSWAPDFGDRTVRRPHLSVRRASATIAKGRVTVDLGKQFIRWGKADIVTPTDRFAPRDFLNVVDNDFLAVTGARGVIRTDSDTLEVVWVPRFTPSRIPLLDQRWTAVPAGAAQVGLVDAGAVVPDGSQTGLRWGHQADRYELSVSFFDGFNHLPDVDVIAAPVPRGSPPLLLVHRRYPPIRMYGGDAAVPTRLVTVKAEAAWFTSSSPLHDEYVLYVVQLERQTGEWVLVGGYAGEWVTAARAALVFAPDRGLARSLVARASYTIDPNRSVAFEGAVRQNAHGAYAKIEFSQAHGQHWRTTLGGTVIAGREDDFLGQYRRNSHAALALRYSF